LFLNCGFGSDRSELRGRSHFPVLTFRRCGSIEMRIEGAVALRSRVGISTKAIGVVSKFDSAPSPAHNLLSDSKWLFTFTAHVSHIAGGRQTTCNCPIRHSNALRLATFSADLDLYLVLTKDAPDETEQKGALKERCNILHVRLLQRIRR
jgi:hypothetical protein